MEKDAEKALEIVMKHYCAGFEESESVREERKDIAEALSQARSEGIREGIDAAKRKFKNGDWHFKVDTRDIHLSHGCVPKEDCENQVKMAYEKGREEGFNDCKKQYDLVLDPNDTALVNEIRNEQFEKGWNSAISEAVKVARDFSERCACGGCPEAIAEKLAALRKK